MSAVEMSIAHTIKRYTHVLFTILYLLYVVTNIYFVAHVAACLGLMLLEYS